MWLWVGIIGAWGWVCTVDVPPLVRQRKVKELMLISVIMIVMTAGSMTYIYMSRPPNPLVWLGIWISPYARALYSLMS
ncbi:hypothetical protein [Paenibacillus paridis]|uniref:hypothetical protein n=1 Tax=Paenibacillus paridis TaxID=2583376 RepID=UPI001122BD70|nr:hypothetical protein [Paenibacillus paridis]